jgi:hypothetical protein
MNLISVALIQGKDAEYWQASLLQASVNADQIATMKVLARQGVNVAFRRSEILTDARSAQMVAALIAVGASAQAFRLPILPADVDPDVVAALYTAREPVPGGDSDSRALLAKAALHRKPRLMAKLLELGVDPNAFPVERPLVALARQCRGSRSDCFESTLSASRLLIDAGADVNLVDSSDRFCRTPLEEAQAVGHPQLVALLLTSGAEQDPPAKQACLAAKSSPGRSAAPSVTSSITSPSQPTSPNN